MLKKKEAFTGKGMEATNVKVATGIVFDVQLTIWRPRSCSTDGVKNALLISHFIKFNPLYFQKN